jgi:hypothetical protein
MNTQDTNNRIKANFDLESEYDKNNTDMMNLEDIFNELVRILQEIDIMMDKKFKKE